MTTFLRSLAFPVACALTGAAAAMLVTHLAARPAPTCPATPVLAVHSRVVPAPVIHHVHTPPPPPPVIQHVYAPPPPPVIQHVNPAPEHPPLQIPDDAIRCSSEGRCSIDRVFLATLIDNPGLLTRQARVIPSILDGVTRGLRFYGLRPNSLLRRLGFKNGDMLTAINGVPATSVGVLMAQPNPLAHGTFVLDIERKGEPLQLRIGVE